MRKILLIVTFLLSLLFTVSCFFGTFASFTRTSNVYYESLPSDAFVKIFVQKVPKKELYQEIGIITVRGNSLEYRYEQARMKARHVGANALISISEKDRIEYRRIDSTDVTQRNSRTNYYNPSNYNDYRRRSSKTTTDTYYTTRSENLPVHVTEESFLAIAIQKSQISDNDLVDQSDFTTRR